MIAEVISGFYDFDGKRISRPSKKRHASFKGRPMGSFLSQPLKVVCRDLNEIRVFLSTCRYVSDREQFGMQDHWMPPEEFEQIRKGDCDDFALWACRQLLSLGYDARFVVGRVGRYGASHAWVVFREGEKTFIVEPTAARVGGTLPRLETLRYKPSVSVEFSGNQVKFFEHTSPTLTPPFRVVASLVPAWLFFWLRMWSRLLLWILWPFFSLRRVYRRRWGRVA
jgi:hypothetical protein